MKPLIAVDVDGVLNRLGGRFGWPEPDDPDDWLDAIAQLADGRGFTIRYNPDHGAKLLQLATDTGAELVWCTTWEGQANEHIAPLVGLPELRWVPLELGRVGMKFSEYRDPGLIKALALQEWAGSLPWVWFDDDARVEHVPATYVNGSYVPHVLIQVDPVTGLQPKHFERAKSWLEALDQDAAA